MNPEQLLKNFRKYGGFVIFLNHAVAFLILTIAFPVFSDLRVLALAMGVMIISFTILFTYYMMDMRQLMKIITRTDEESYVIKKKRFKKYPMKVMGLNTLFIFLFYIPTVSAMYLFFGYSNIYYMFFVLSITIFVFIYLGFNSMLIWYARTYPMGRSGVPIYIQKLGNKILSLVIPTVLMATIAISVMIYFVNYHIIARQIDLHVSDTIEMTGERLLLETPDSERRLPGIVTRYQGIVVVTDNNGQVTYSSDSNMRNSRIPERIEKGDMPDSLYASTLRNIEAGYNDMTVRKFKGVFDGSHSVFFSRSFPDSNRNILLIFSEKALYSDFYFSIFIQSLFLFIINIGIALLLYRKLSRITRSIQQLLPALTRAAQGDLTGEISLVKTRDILEDFTRTFITFIATIRDYLKQTKRLSLLLLDESELISNAGNSVKQLSLENVDLLEESTDIVQTIVHSLTDIDSSASAQDSNITDLEKAVDTLNQSMTILSHDANNVIKSMGNVEENAQESSDYVNSAFDGMQKTGALYEGVLNIIQLISDIADQVNLLSLNASIEAARAGEYGRGFSVVAEEISKLADKTGSNVKDITRLINEGNIEIKENLAVMSRMKNSFDAIVGNIEITGLMISGFIDMINTRVNEIHRFGHNISAISNFSQSLCDSTGEQKKNAETIISSIQKVNSGAKMFVNESQRLSESSQKLKEMAVSLIGVLKNFTI